VTVGPLELVVVGFEGNNFTGQIAPAIGDAVSSGAIRIVDLIFVTKDADGAAVALEVEDLGENIARDFRGLQTDLHDLLSEEDAVTLAELLPNNTAALVALIEHTWATRISEAVRNAGGRMLASQRLSARNLEAVHEELEAAMAAPAHGR
jgi:uncharacterized membrane protein